MRFQQREQIRPLIFNDLPGQQHAAGFASDHAGSDHVAVNLKIVFGCKVLPDQSPHLLIAAHHNFTHTRAGLRDIHPALMHLLRKAKEPVPGIRVFFGAGSLESVHHLIEPAHLNTVQQRPDGAGHRVILMRQKHCLQVPPPDLFRADVNRPPVRIDIQKQLCRVLDFGNGLCRMSAPDQRKEGDRIQLKQKRTGDAEEIAHHQIRRPGSLQFRQAVKNVESVPAGFRNQVVDRDRERLKPVRQFNVYCPDLRMAFRQRRVRRETNINDLPPVPDGLIQIRIQK